MASLKTTTVAGQFDVRIDVRDLRRKLASLPKRVGTATVRRALLAGSRVVGQEARRNVPVRTGNLKRSIGWETRGVFRDASGVPTEHRAAVLIKKPRGGRRNARSYAHIVEGGAQPHAVGKGSVTHVFKRSKAKARSMGPMHPGFSARRFMARAFDASAAEAVRTIESTLRAEVAKEVAKLAREKVGV